MLTENPGIAVIKSEAIKIVNIEPAGYPAGGIPLAVDAGDEGITTALPFVIYKEKIEIEVPYPAPGLVLDLEVEGT